jgi:putative membrane protein (TIGR04086 family)
MVNTYNNRSSYSISLIKSILLSYLVTFAFFFVFAIILTYTSLSDSTIPTLNSIVMIVSIAVGGGYMAAKVNKKGWLNGGLIGLIYIIILAIFRILADGGMDFSSYFFVKLIISIITGAIGGMIGINLK